MGKLRIDTLTLGAMATNCYLAMNKETKRSIIIDPGDEPERVIRKMEDLDGVPEAILLTHGHFDHIGAAQALQEHYSGAGIQIPICALREELAICESPSDNLSAMFGAGYTVRLDRLFEDNEEPAFAGVKVKVLHTPGHTAGGACYYIEEEKTLFSGDTLFCCSVGRTDFPTGSMAQLGNAIHTRLFVLPEDTLVLPGHGESTSIGYEKKYNPY